MAVIELTAPFCKESAAQLRAGDRVSLSGVIYTARDAAHARLIEALDADGKLPFPLKGAVIYYVGPTPAKPGRVIGSAGPTTSGRMDVFTPRLLSCGMKGMIGKGARSEAVKKALIDSGGVYLAAVGGAGALIARRIVSAEVIAYPDLGPEAVHRLEIDRLPLVVVNDSVGGDYYEQGRAEYEVS